MELIRDVFVLLCVTALMVAIPLALIGALVLLFGASIQGVLRRIRESRKGHASLTWPATTGQIVSAEIEVIQDVNWESHHLAKVRYKYEVDGVEYTGHRIRFGRPIRNKRSAIRAVEPYPPGSTIKVFYNPSDPADSVLEPGPLEPGPQAVSKWDIPKA